LETLLPVFYTTAVHERSLSPSLIARLTAENPAKHFGFYPRKGHLSVGADADIAVLSKEQLKFDQQRMTSKIKWTPYHGMEMAGVVRATYVRGRKVFDGQVVLAGEGYGKFIKPE
jgi:allantoinase